MKRHIGFVISLVCCTWLYAAAVVAQNDQTKDQDYYHIQTFNLDHGLVFQIRYINQDPVTLYMKNTGDKAIKVKIYNEVYPLAPGDTTQLNQPNLKNVFVEVTPHHYIQTLFPLPTKDSRFAKTYLFEMPVQKNDVTTKSIK